MTDMPATTIPPELARLRGKIGWICHGLRVAAVAYPAWVLYILLTYWTNASAINTSYGRMLHADLTGMSAWQQGAALSTDLVVWLCTAVACICAWRLCSAYLEGRIFSLDASLWMRRVALWGIAAQVLSIASRPLVSAILTVHLEAGQQAFHGFFQPNDLLTLVLLTTLLALAHIQKAGAEIAADHAQIV
jgi:hypothetical protein